MVPVLLLDHTRVEENQFAHLLSQSPPLRRAPLRPPPCRRRCAQRCFTLSPFPLRF
jgi:hypothetical protein